MLSAPLPSPSSTPTRRAPERRCIISISTDFKGFEALDIGFCDYIDSGALCIIEWPENIEEILPEETLRVSIRVHPDESRTLSWEI